MEYDSELYDQMKPDDVVVEYLPLEIRKDGCLGPKEIPGGYIAITEQRLIFKGSLINGTGARGEIVSMTEQTTNVPISKVSSISVTVRTTKEGCLSLEKKYYSLSINVQGGVYEVYLGQNRGAADAFVRSFLDRGE